jgi:broad specificity polyphosphatase/5'/3'-nucleotidase SurE
MTGNFKDLEQNPENNGDHNLMDQGYITIVPHKIDTTCYATMEQLENGWEL